MKLRLNHRPPSATSQPTDNPELAAAWAKIFASKLTPAQHEKLAQVKAAMDAGELARSTADKYTKTGRPKPLSKAEALRLYDVLADRQRAAKLREMVESTPANYRLITSTAQMDELLTQLAQEPIIAIDTETTGLDVYTDVIVGISLTLPVADVHVYIPVGHDEGEQLDRDYVLAKLRPVLYDESIGKVLHNAVYDIAMFRRHGSDLLGVAWDTMTAMHLLNENEPSFKLKDLAPKFLGVESDTFAALFGKTPFNEIALDIALVYAAKDTDLTWRLYEFQREHMERLPTILDYYREVEVPILYVVTALEANGYVLDLDFAREYGEKLHRRADELQAEIIEALTPYHDGDEPINLNSPQQMRPALAALTGEKLPNMDAKKTLKPLRKKHAIIGTYIEYKDIAKLSGTYIDALPKKQNPTTGRWHSRYNPMGTVTGRFSSGKDEEDTTGQGFNAQNQPKEARRMFVAPPGKIIVGADFKAQEIRCVAYLSEEPVLIDAFLTNRDPYASMAANYYGRPYEDVYKQADGSDTPERKKFKVVWLATLYGMSDFSLAEMLGTDRKSATEFKREIFGTMPKLQSWLKANEEFVKRNGYVWADKKARKRRLPDAKLRREFIPKGKWNDPAFENARKHNASINRALRQGTNARVQGSSSIQTKVTMIAAHEACQQREGWRLWGSVHDELLFEVPATITREDIEVIRDIMVNSYKWGDVVPNGTDIEIMERWGEGVSENEWFNERN